MILSYIFDLCNLIGDDDVRLPFIEEVNLFHGDLSVDFIKTKRDEVSMRHAQERIEKHLFFAVIDNDPSSLDKLAQCFKEMAADITYFGTQHYCELHVICNYVRQDGFTLQQYERTMVELAKNPDVGLYSWIVDEYNYTGNLRLTDTQKAHAILRLTDFLQNHRNDETVSLQSFKQIESSKTIVDKNGEQRQVADVTNKLCYHLFGNSFIFIDESKERSSMLTCYKFKNLQHLLNLTDKDIDSYIKDELQSIINDDGDFDKVIDGSSEEFLCSKIISVPASKITEQTQNILLKDSAEDKEYLVDIKTNKLVFIEEIEACQNHGLEGFDSFLKEYYELLHQENDPQDIISERFTDDLKSRVVKHSRLNFNRLNNTITDKRCEKVESFKKIIEKRIALLLDKRDGENYSILKRELNDLNVQNHASNIDYGLAFLDVLISGSSPRYLKDSDVSNVDVNLNELLDSSVESKREKLSEFDRCIREYTEKTKPDENGNSYFKTKFNAVDAAIKKQREIIFNCNCELQRWLNDTKCTVWHKLTARTKFFVLITLCLLITGIAIYFTHEYCDEDSIRFWIPGIIFILGIIVSLIPIVKVLLRRKNANEELGRQKDLKRGVMRELGSLANRVIEARFNFILAYHSEKTFLDILNFLKRKRATLLSFKKQLFKQCIRYRLDSIGIDSVKKKEDFNTIEIERNEPLEMLFASGDNSRHFCFNFTNSEDDKLSVFFDGFCRKVSKFETSRLEILPQSELDIDTLKDEQIDPMDEHKNRFSYAELNKPSLIPAEQKDFRMEDIRQGQCGDCYFMAALASIAKKQPGYLANMITTVGENHEFYSVQFYNENGERVSVGINNKFWTADGETPIYANISKDMADGYDTWVMAIEKAWAKANGGSYEKIEGVSGDGKERTRMVEYSFAITGRNAYYCLTQKVPNKMKLLESMKEHFNGRGLPITLYSASDFDNMEPTIVQNHAYALESINEDGTFDIFNPWNSRQEGEIGQHYKNKDIDFLVNNFDVVVFFDINESDSNKLDITLNIDRGCSLLEDIDSLMCKCFSEEDASAPIVFDNIINGDHLERFIAFSLPLFRQSRVIDDSGTFKQCFLYGKESKKIAECLDEHIGVGNYIHTQSRDGENACSMYRFVFDYLVDDFRK